MQYAGVKDTFNIAARLLEDNASQRGDKIALYCGDEKVSYRELLENVNRFANILRDLGVRPTERVMIHLPDSPTFVHAFLGSIKYGAWPVPINTMLNEHDYEYILADSEARVLVTEKNSSAARAKSDHFCYRLFADEGLDDLLKRSSIEADTYPAREDDIAFWLYSSGSTGRPKGTPHKHCDMMFTADTYGRHVVQIAEDDIVFSVSKLFFAYGLGNSISIPFRHGASTVLLSDRPMPEKVMETISRFEPTLFFGVPTLYNSLLKKMNGTKFPSIRACASAGEALPPEVFRKWQEKTGLRILDGIGSTEALHIFISNFGDEVKAGTSGKLVPGFEAKIVDHEGNIVEEGETGYLLIRGRSVTPGYWNRPEANAEKIDKDGWFRTGDMYSEEEGFFTYQGREDDMLKIGGIWVSPVEIENVLMEHQAVEECAVVGQEIEGLVKPFAYVVAGPKGYESDKEALRKSILDFAAQNLPKFKCPWDVFLPDELPKTATGKFQRFKLRLPPLQPYEMQA